MKVLYILDYGTVGGATHSFLELVVQMKKLGVEPVVCLGKHTNIDELFDKVGIEYFCAGHRTVLEPFLFKGMKWPLRLLKKALHFYIQEQIALYRLKKVDWSSFDLIHTNSARNDIGCYLNKRYGIPHVMHIREFADTDFDCISFRPHYINFFNRYTTCFISISEAVKWHWFKKGVQKDKMFTIYNGIHIEDIMISPDDDKYMDKLRLLIAGGVGLPKGQHLAVEALGLLPENIRGQITLDIVGWGDENYLKEIKKYAEERGYMHLIHYLGTVKDLHSQLGNYQMGLMCSRAEGFGRVTAEYMHAKLGVIASDSGANPELIEDGVTGLLFKSGSAQSLANCIMRFYNDRELLIRLSNAGKKKAIEHYTQQKNADAIYELYKKILK